MVVLSKLNDQELIKLCLDGNSDCFSELYVRYNKMVFNSILRLVIDFAQAEDLLQEVFISLYQEIMKGRQIEYFGGFSKRVAINKAIRFLQNNRHMISFTDDYHDIADDEYEDEDHFEMRVEEVKNAINSLPAGYRTIVNLYVWEGLRHEEIAELLDVSHATVRSQYHRAKNKILSLITKGDYTR